MREKGAAPPTEIADLISFPNKDMHTPPRTIIAMATEIEGERVSGTASEHDFQILKQGLRLHLLLRWKNSCWQF